METSNCSLIEMSLHRIVQHVKCPRILPILHHHTLPGKNLDILLPNIINTSLTTGIVPRDLKTAVVKSLLKNTHHLTKYLVENYRPISNLPFLSKILEKIVLHQRVCLPSPSKQPQQPLSVSLSSRTLHQDRFVTFRKRHSLRSGQWQYFCSSFVGSLCRF